MTATLDIIWDIHDRYIIRDVNEKFMEKVGKFMLENHFIPHRLYNKMSYQDDPQVNEQYLKFVQHVLRGEGSIIAIDADTGSIHAVGLAKCMTKEWRCWTDLILCMEPSKFMEIIYLHKYLIDECAIEFPEIPFDTFHVFDFYIDEKLKHDFEFVGKFLNSLTLTAVIMKMPRITFVALSLFDQHIFHDNYYEALNSAIYSIYTHGKRRPFALLRDLDEMEALLFQIEISPPIPYYEIKVRGIDEIERKPDEAERRSSLEDSSSAL